nr:Toll/interleukin-1 receptor (TIR) domain-containing protein [Tanacetum cinerariifolium]
MTIGSSLVTDFFHVIKSKADRLANLESPVKDSSLVTYAINEIRSKYPDAAHVIRLREKAPTFVELRSMLLIVESDMSHQPVSSLLLHTSSFSPTVLVASTTPHDKANNMNTSGFDTCRNFQRGSCSYGARFILVVVVVIVRVVIVVVGGVSSIDKLSFMIIGFEAITFPSMLWGSPAMKASIGWAYAFHQDKALSVRVPVTNVTLFSLAQLLRENTNSVRSNQRMSPTTLSVFAMVAAYASRAAAIPSAISYRMTA